MKLNLPDSVASSQDLTALALEIRAYAGWFAHESIKKRGDIRQVTESPLLSAAAEELLRAWGKKKPIDGPILDGLIETLDAYQDSARSITITLAAPPSTGLKSNLVSWCRQNIAPNILVTFRFNATLLGGMVVCYGSRVFDWSFRRQILANRANFPEVLRNV